MDLREKAREIADRKAVGWPKWTGHYKSVLGQAYLDLTAANRARPIARFLGFLRSFR